MHTMLMAALDQAPTDTVGTGVVVIAGTAGLAALVLKLTDFLRLVTNLASQRSAVLTQLCAWAAGIGATFLYGASQLGNFVIPGTTLTIVAMNGATKVIVGLSFASVASTVVDLKQSRDNSDSAAKPPLLGPPG